MGRAERRALERRIRSTMRTRSLSHPVPGSVELIGGPMAGWVVRPAAPALRPDWHAGLLEARAAGLARDDGLPWDAIEEEMREQYLELVRKEEPPGRYVVDGTRARWTVDG